MLKIAIENVNVKVAAQYRRAGSILAGTASAGCDGVRIEVFLDSDATPDQLGELLRVAEASCYVAGALREPVPVEVAATFNGTAYPL